MYITEQHLTDQSTRRTFYGGYCIDFLLYFFHCLILDGHFIDLLNIIQIKSTKPYTVYYNKKQKCQSQPCVS